MSSRVSPQSRRIRAAPISPETTEKTAATRSSWAPAQRTVLPSREAPVMAICFGVDGFVGLEVVDRPADAPGPGADGAPLVGSGLRLAGLEREPDDAFRPSVGPIRLDLVVDERGVSPAVAEHLAQGVESAGTEGRAVPAAAALGLAPVLAAA